MNTKFRIAFLLPVIVCLASCSDPDADVKADLTAKARKQIEFAGVGFTVDSGVVSLSGACPTGPMRDQLEATVREVYGVTGVRNSIRIAPVVIGTDRELKLRVDSVLQEYPQARAEVSDSVVVLQGQVKSAQVNELIAALQGLGPRQLENRLEVR